MRSVAVILAVTMLVGCDDQLGFVVEPAGTLLALVDGNGEVEAVGDGRQPRHLVRLDPVARTATRLTTEPRALSWLRAGPDGAVVAVEREPGEVDRLILLQAGETRTLASAAEGLHFYQPEPSPNGRYTSVLEAAEAGRAGALRVLALEDGREVARLEQALVGAAWAGTALIVPRVTGAPSSEPFGLCDGELTRWEGGRRTALFRGTLGGLPFLTAAPGGEELLAVLPRGEEPVLTRVRMDGGGARPALSTSAGCDLWLAAGPGGLLFTRADPEAGSLAGELRLAPWADLSASRPVPTDAACSSPRWLADGRLAYLTSKHHLIVQGPQGQDRVDLTTTLEAALAAESPR